MAIASKQLKFESQLMVELLACVHVCLHEATDTYISVHVSHLVNAQPTVARAWKNREY